MPLDLGQLRVPVVAAPMLIVSGPSGPTPPTTGPGAPTHGALSPYRVLDFTTRPAWLTGKLLADLGADVIKVEPPGGDPGRGYGPFADGVASPEESLAWWALNRGKRSVTADPATASGRDLILRLAATADAVLESYQPGQLEAWGLGLADLAAAEAAVHTTAALYHAARTGRGQQVDVSAQLTTVRTLMNAMACPHTDGTVPRRSTFGRPAAGSPYQSLYPCADGHVIASVGFGPGVEGYLRWLLGETGSLPGPLAAALGAGIAPDYAAAHPGFAGQVSAALALFFAARTKEQLTDQALAHRLMLVPINTAADLYADVQLASRDYFTTVEHAGRKPVRYPSGWVHLSGTPLAATARAPRAGEHDAALREPDGLLTRTRPAAAPVAAADSPVFAGLRVWDASWVGVGPLTTKYLADQGATVIRSESARNPDVLRLAPPFRDGVRGINRSQFFADFNTSKFQATALLDYDVNGHAATRDGNRSPEAAPHGIYPCRPDGVQDRWIAIAVEHDDDWPVLTELIGSPAWAADPALRTLAGRKAAEDLIDRELAAWTAERDRGEVFRLLQPRIAAAPVNDPADLHRDPQLEHRRYLRVLCHPEMGPTLYEGPQADLSLTPARLAKAAPCLGEDTRWALGLLGYDPAAIDELIEAGAAQEYTPPAAGPPGA